MHLVGRHHVVQLSEAEPYSRGWLRHFVAEVLHANWKRENDLRSDFPRCVRFEDGTFAFPIQDAGRLLHVAFSFRTATAIILGTKTAP